MTYPELKDLFHEYRMARLSRAGLEAAIGLWQRTEFGEVARTPICTVKWRDGTVTEFYR